MLCTHHIVYTKKEIHRNHLTQSVELRWHMDHDVQQQRNPEYSSI